MTQEADAAFPAERLARQRARILQRVDQDGRPARVIAFPAGHTHDSCIPPRPPGALGNGGRRRGRIVPGGTAGRASRARHTGQPPVDARRASAGECPEHAGSRQRLRRRTARSGRARGQWRWTRRAETAGCPDAARLGRALIVSASDPRRDPAMTQSPLIFRKGLDLKHEVAQRARGELSQRARRGHQGVGLPIRVRPSDPVPRAGIRLLLRSGSRCRLRVSDAEAISRPHRLSDGRDHPQPARQRSDSRARDPISQRSGRIVRVT